MFEGAFAQLATQGSGWIVATILCYVVYHLYKENNSLKDELVAYIKEQKAGIELSVLAMNKAVEKILDLVISLGQK